MDQVLHLNEFFIEGDNPNLSHVLLHITEPSTPEEKAKGYFFAVCEIKDADSRQIMKIQSLIDELENGYYETPDREDKTSLEILLEKINQQYPHLLRLGAKLNCVVGVIRQPEIFFSFYGQPQIHIFYQNKENAYQKMDLVESNSDESDENRLFSQIIQGKISPNDYFFVGTERIKDYLSSDRIQKIITTRPPRQSAQHLEKTLSELNNGLSFGGLIIHLSPPSAQAAVKPRKKFEQNSDSSLKSLFNTEQHTADTLSPSLVRRLSDKLSGAWADQRGRSKAAQIPAKAEGYPAEIEASHLRQHQRAVTAPSGAEKFVNGLKFISRLLKFTAQAIGWLAVLLWSGLLNLLRFLYSLFVVTLNYKGQRQAVLQNWSRAWYSYRQNFRALPRLTKILFVSSIILAMTFVISLIVLKYRQNTAAATQFTNQTLESIRTKKDAAEGALIYNNQTVALSEAQGAMDLFKNLNCNNKSIAEDCNNLKQALNDIFTKVRKLITVHPTLLTDWSSAATSTTQIFKMRDKLYAFGPAGQNLYIYDLLTKESKLLPLPPDAKNLIQAAIPKENDFAILLYGGRNLLRLDAADNSFKRLDLSLASDQTALQSLLIYNRRLYSLSPTDNQIFKHDSIKTGFGLGKDWIKDTAVDIKDGVDLCIDGDIFVLKANGQVIKFTQGQRQTFEITGLDPVLSGGQKIWTYTDLQYLYILDKTEKRLVILGKDGHLIQQITATEFKAPTGLVVDEVKKTGYILDSGKLYQFGW